MRARLALASVVLAAAVVAAGCGSNHASPGPTGPATTTTQPTTATTSTTTPAPPQMALTLYKVEKGVVVPTAIRIPQTPAVAAAALTALGIHAPVTVANGTATVDLASPTRVQTVELVYTLTQFPTVQRVDVGGRTRLTRADFAGYAPAILIDTPAAGARVAPTFHVSGSAVVFEGTLVVELQQAGKTVQHETVTASAGAPERGAFATTLTAPQPGPATVVAYAPSAENGAHQHRVTVAVTVIP